MANNNLNLTYDDFEREAKKYNLFNEFSADDLAIARQDPSAGLSLLSFKRDWHAADSPEAQEAANRGAEGIRNLWNYSGGIDGSKHYMNDTPTVTDPNYNLSWTSLTNYIPKTAPERNPEYENLYRDYLNQIINRDKFSYDAENDPNYLQYKNQYTREGNRAMQDTLGQISARSGGLASSYAGTAAAQANNYYMQQLADKIPELYQQAYNRYLKEFEMQMDTLGAIGNGRDYNLSAYNADRNAYEYDNNFRYGQIGDALNAMYTENDIKNQLEQQAKENAWTEADRAMKEEEWKAKMADAYAQMGNYDKLLELGGDPSLYQPTSGGGGGYYGGGGSSTSSSSDGSRKGSAIPGTGAQSAVTDAGKWDYIDRLAAEYGDEAAKNYIKANYQALNYKGVNAALADYEIHKTTSAGSKKTAAPTADKVYDYGSAKSWMESEGVPASVAKGLMNNISWTAKRAAYKATGKGDAAVANYDSYEDYVRAYCEYALSVS